MMQGRAETGLEETRARAGEEAVSKRVHKTRLPLSTGREWQPEEQAAEQAADLEERPSTARKRLRL
jgi:hypothetical protein